MKRALTIAAAVLAAGCGEIPKDPDGTLERVRAERQFKVGLIAADAPTGPDRQQALLNRLSAATGAAPSIEVGAMEPLLSRLEEGELDLVLGPLSPKSPWGKQVTIIPPLAEQVTREGHTHLSAIARNGENAWISLLHREAAEVAAVP
jgi:DNA-binding transcriptional LysR family regulator